MAGATSQSKTNPNQAPAMPSRPGISRESFSWWTGPSIAFLLFLIPSSAHAVSCTTQAAISPPEAQAISAAANPLAEAITGANYEALHSALLPAVAQDWDSIRGVAEAATPLTKSGQLHWRTIYLLDASDLKTSGDTQFFCTNSDSSITVTINLHSLPPGRYSFLVADFPGAPLAAQLAFILGTDATANNQWKLGGLFAREGALEGRDGVWYWSRARLQSANKTGWSAWFSYDTARWLLIPVDFVSTPNLEQLNKEQAQLATSPPTTIPFSVTSPSDPTKSWQITALHLDTTLHFADLGLTYEGTGLTDPIAARAEATMVMTALLKQHPELREGFHGLWAYAEKEGKHTFAIELPMSQIP